LFGERAVFDVSGHAHHFEGALTLDSILGQQLADGASAGPHSARQRFVYDRHIGSTLNVRACKCTSRDDRYCKCFEVSRTDDVPGHRDAWAIGRLVWHAKASETQIVARQWNHRGRRGGQNARESLRARQQFTCDGQSATPVITGKSKINDSDIDAFDSKAGINAVRIRERPCEDQGRDDEQERHRDLCNEKRLPKTEAARSA
jgi:hypothetical protein